MAQSSDRIVRGLRRAGVDVDVAHLTRAPRPWRSELVEGGQVRVCPLEDDPEHALRRLWTDLSEALPGRPARPFTHVVAFGGTLPMLAGPIYARWLGAPLVTLLRGNDLDTGIFSVRRQPIVLDALSASARVCVVASSNVPLVGALTTAPVTFVANGIDVGDWDALPSERARATRWRADHVDAGRRTVGFIGQLKRKKGVLFLLEALERTSAVDQLHLVLVGDVEAAVLEWLDKHEDTIAFTHLPFLDRFELLGLFPACDVIALPSFYDGLPNVALEAAALGMAERLVPDGPSWEEGLALAARLGGAWVEEAASCVERKRTP
jgi:glycosyltransferase involved in cell wall biosynthesis